MSGDADELFGDVDRPLSGIRVLDLVGGPLACITRYLAELGARVDRVDSGAKPDYILGDLAANIGKHYHAMSPAGNAVRGLAEVADIIVANAERLPDISALREARPRLVTMAVSDFGSETSLSGWQATGPVLHALSGELSRSGIRGRPPLLPPGDLAYQCAASQAAYALVAALYRALRTGVGGHLDFCALDGAVQALDPGFGVNGSATMGKPAHLLVRDRPAKGFQYPILPCADGHVRICLLSKRQWQGMFRWMGEPAAFASPEFEKTAARYKSPDLLPVIAAFFAGRTRAELEAEGQGYGVPISAVLDFAECVATEHMRERMAFREVGVDGGSVRLPNGVVAIDGARMEPVMSDAGTMEWAAPATDPSSRVFEGLRVLDLGVIVVGAEQGRLLADQGADVVKVESSAYPDGNRQSYLSYGMSVSFAAGHRNKRSLGINLRQPEGKALFLQLAAKADIVMSNFKPGTLESLGLAYSDIAAINPRIVMIDSSAFGATGPWSGRMGYGPLVRAATGLTLAWRYPDDPEGFSDSITIYPDHVAARIGAMAAVALLIRRLRTGRGGKASIAQSEVMLTHFAEQVARQSRGEPVEAPPDWPWAVYPALGDDEWCVVTVRDQRDWAALCTVIDFGDGLGLDTPAKRLAARSRIDKAISAWMASREPQEVARLLQAAGVPAAPMLRIADMPDYSYFKERRFYRTEGHPYLREPVIAERWHVKAASLPDALEQPAPLACEHSEEICAGWLELSPERISDLVACGALEPIEPRILAEAHDAMADSARKIQSHGIS